MALLLFRINSQSGVGYKIVAYKKACNDEFCLLKMMKQLCHMSLFLYFSGISLRRYLSKKKCCQKPGFAKNIKNGWVGGVRWK